jgi:hypothetical protein
LRQRVEHPPGDYYATLGVERRTSCSEIHAAGQALIERWNPERLAHAPRDLRELAALLHAHLAEACRELSDPFARAAYDAKLKGGTLDMPDQARLAQAFRRMLGTRRAEVLLAQGRRADAEREVLLAIGGDTMQYELIALHIWLRAHDPSENLPRLLARFDHALGGAPEAATLHWYRGLLLKKMAMHASALQEFRAVVELDPRHTDAAREVRLYEMTRDEWLPQTPRARSGTFVTSPSGFLRKLLGNDGEGRT